MTSVPPHYDDATQVASKRVLTEGQKKKRISALDLIKGPRLHPHVSMYY
jgi:hypothetical protein